MKTKTITVYADPGHAWAKVKIKELLDLGICQDISQFSYMHGEHAYLEEDCDLSRYINALGENRAPTIKFKEHHSNKRSRIRSYYRFNGVFIKNEYDRQCERAELLIAAKKSGILHIVKVGE